MALPTLDKTWQVTPSVALASGSNLAWSQTLMYAIKNSITNVASNPWVVVRSSNAVSSGAADYWASTADLIWGANTSSTRSWIVLGQDGINSGFEMLIDLTGGTVGAYIDIWISESAGFTGGSLTARPTATDEVECFAGETKLWGGTNLTRGGRLHVMQSSDGECTRIVQTYTSGTAYAEMFWLIDKPKNPADHWTNPWVMFLYSSNANVHAPIIANLSTTSSNGQANIDDVKPMAMMSPQATNSNMINSMNFADEVSSDWPFWRVRELWCDAAGYRGTKGELFDLWWGAHTADLQLLTYPSDASYQFVQFEDLIFPWDGTLPILT